MLASGFILVNTQSSLWVYNSINFFAGHILQVVGIPAEFPLALLYCEHLIGFIQDQVADLVHVGINALSILFEFLLKTTMPPVIKVSFSYNASY